MNEFTDNEPDEDWEEWDPSRTSFLVHMFSGSIAGLAEHVLMFPIDTMKTHIQTRQSQSSFKFPVIKELKMMLRHGGMRGLFRGMSSVIYGAGPAHAAYFSIYEMSKKTFDIKKDKSIPFRSALSGALATLSHDMIITPIDVVKQRLQV